MLFEHTHKKRNKFFELEVTLMCVSQRFNLCEFIYGIFSIIQEKKISSDRFALVDKSEKEKKIFMCMCISGK